MRFLAVTILTVLFLISCSQGPAAPVQVNNNPVNSNPVIEDISYVQNTQALTTIEISCQASDKDGDQLKYEWSAETGDLKGSGSTVTWTAPDNNGAYTISVKVSDGKGGTASKSILIKVPQKEEIPAENDLSKIPLEKALVNGKPTLADFGWKICIPCKAMKPILEELAVEYSDRVNVLIVEVYDPAQEKLVTQYGIKSIPTQVFFDKNGKEVNRHIGFISKADILIQLRKIGVR